MAAPDRFKLTVVGQGSHAVLSQLTVRTFASLVATQLTSQVGTIMAASDRFNITVLGQGGHAGLPHRAKDPVVAAAALVGVLQVDVSASKLVEPEIPTLWAAAPGTRSCCCRRCARWSAPGIAVLL